MLWAAARWGHECAKVATATVDAMHHRPVFLSPMHAAAAIATIITTGTGITGPGVRTRVHD
jgi:hypothetical protein